MKLEQEIHNKVINYREKEKEASLYLLESLADLLGLELTAKMLELCIGKFSLTNYMLRRLLPVVPEQHKIGLRRERTQILTCLSCP